MPDPALAAFARLFGPEFGHGKPFDLARLRAALEALGAPQQKLAPIVHVAGTNGKGSTIAFMRAIAEAAGLSVHAFTKPHLLTLNERFLIAGTPAAEEALIAAAERIAAIDAGLTQFDAQAAAALLLFAQTPADLILMETGMGGRDDATNILTPALSVITPIARDHQEALGATLADIAAHKAGIIKPGVPAVIGRQDEAARQILEMHAEQAGAPLFRHGVEWDAYESSGQLVVQTQNRALDLPRPSLYGAHQLDNAGLACAALLRWRDLHDGAFAAGVAWARWPGRLEPLTRGRLSAPIRALGGEVWIDCGHNPHAAAALAQAMAEMKARRGGVNIVIVGLRARKDGPGFVSGIARGADRLIAIPLPEAHIEPRAIASLAHELEKRANTAATLQEAMAQAAQFIAPRVLICGSFLLSAEALALEAG